jgi:hypothetical protein
MKNVFAPASVTKQMLRRFSCSETTLTILNTAAGLGWKELEEASDPLCAGLVAEMDGACGVLWGAALTAGVRARARIPDSFAAREATLVAACRAVEAFRRAGHPMNCAEITGMDAWNFARYMLRGNLGVCSRLLCGLAPAFHDLIDRAIDEHRQRGAAAPCRNCAVEAFERVSAAIGFPVDGASVVAAGFAGGLGLSGNVCGALAAAILAVSLKYFTGRNRPKHSMIRSDLQGLFVGIGWMKPSMEIARQFRIRFPGRTCASIAGRTFATNGDLSAHLVAGRCEPVLEAVVSAARAVVPPVR